MKRLLVRGCLCAVAVAAVITASALADGPGTASTGAACCQLTTSLAQDALQGPDLTGDERFFMSSGAPPNIHFILDTSGSMVEPPIITASNYVSFFSAGLKCDNTLVNSYELDNGWDPNKLYPPPDPGTDYGNDHKGDWDDMFGPYDATQAASSDTHVWRMMTWKDDLYTSNPGPKYAKFEDACESLHDPDDSDEKADYDACVACLKSAGYWFDPEVTFPWWRSGDPFGWADDSDTAKHYLMTSNLLRFMPPKYVTAVATMKQVVTNLSNIRAGITVYNGGNGGALLQEQNPPCNLALKGASNADRASYVNEINKLTFSSNTPLAETLLNVGQYFSYYNHGKNGTPYDKWFGDDSWGNGGSKDGYVKNGANDQNFKNKVSGNNQSRSVCWGCQTSAVVIITDGEPTSDSHIPISKIKDLNGGEVKCPDAAPCDIEDDAHDNSYLDDVAKFLYTQDLQGVRSGDNPVIGDLNTAGTQSVATYGVALGLHTNLLQNAANVGGGFYAEAHDTSTLQTALASIVSAVKTNGTTFSAASLSSLQVNRTGGSILPRFKPSKLGRAAPWDGFLYRFELGSEELFDCVQKDLDVAVDAGTPYAQDLNGDGLCDTVLLDQDEKAVLENDQGQFVLYSDPNKPAKPHWEASAVMQAGPGDGGTAWESRFIVTVVDDTGDGKIDSADTPIAFTEANADKLLPYFGIRDTDPAPCPAIAQKMGYADAGSLSGLECAKAIIRYYRGADVLNPDPGKRGLDQGHLLKDIFHAAPVTVEPPTPKAFCAFSNQCTETLFRTSVQLDGGANPYDGYVAASGKRDKWVLVGANDGMLHVFDDGSYDQDDPATGTYLYTAGTGREVLAFVPPDLLSKMRYHLGEHAFMVDDAAMVREAWIDLDGDGWKDANEYRTIAIVNEGHGGVHHYALDLTDLIPSDVDASFDAAAQTDLLDKTSRFFLWMWPQSCDEAALKVGESYGSYSPRPPPIGAVAIEDVDGHLNVRGKQAREDWVVMFNGGYDQYLSRGRGFAMVDLATGDTLWSAWGDPTASDPRAQMRFPFATGVSMLDVGAGGGNNDGDYIFDTATVPDYGGNVWTLRFWEPGQVDGGVVTNWSFGRGFAVSTDGGIVGEPVTEMTSNAIQPSTGLLHTYVGTGDRYHLTDTGGPHCRFSNPYACAELGCGAGTTASPITVTINRGSATNVAERSTTVAKGTQIASASLATQNSTGAGVDGNACAYSEAKVSLAYPNTCSALSSASLDMVCGAADGGSFLCKTSNTNWGSADPVDVAKDAGISGAFYGYVSYGGTHTFEATDGGTSAAQYETAMLHPSDLTDVSGDTGIASTFGAGWRVSYPSGAVQRTATGSAIVDSCVIWNTFEPGEQTGAICSTAGTNTAHLYQANFESGGTGCFSSLGTARSLARTVVAAPGDPTPQRQVINGRASSGIITLEAGRAQGQTVTGNTELLQNVYQLEVPRPEHACRHEGQNCE
jgi:type IV pilus assembly protein PilY1